MGFLLEGLPILGNAALSRGYPGIFCFRFGIEYRHDLPCLWIILKLPPSLGMAAGAA